MNISSSQNQQQAVNGGFRVDISRGQRIGRVSSEWFSRPDDERFLSLAELYDSVKARADRATARTVESRAVRVEASREDAERLSLIVPGQEHPVVPTHWSFGQLCSLVSAPATYMRQLPAPLAGINLQHGLLSHRAELVKTLEAEGICCKVFSVEDKFLTQLVGNLGTLDLATPSLLISTFSGPSYLPDGMKFYESNHPKNFTTDPLYVAPVLLMPRNYPKTIDEKTM